MDIEILIDNVPETIKKEFIYRNHKKGSLIIFPDEENSYLYILIKGSTEVYRQSLEGTMVSLCLYNAYSCFGELEIFNKAIKTFGVIAKTDCETISMHRKTVLNWMRLDFDFTLYLVEQLAMKLVLGGEATARLSLLTVKDRILNSVYAHLRVGDLNQLTKPQLAVEVCAPIRSVNRSIAQCIREGFLNYEHKKFKVNSPDKIEEYYNDFLQLL